MEIIDLTHTIESEMPCFNADWHCKAVINKMGSIETVGRNTSKILFGSHCGTHIDAPAHFIKNGKTIDKIDLQNFIGDVTVLDFSFLRENEKITIDMINKFNIKDKVIFYFNWAKFFKTEKFYNNYPYFSNDSVDYLINKGVKLIGMDTPSPDDSRIKLLSKDDSLIHKKLLSNEIILIEYLNNLDKIKDFNNWKLIAFPLKIKNGDGSSSRVCIYKE